jgi:hypothetical protein
MGEPMFHPTGESPDLRPRDEQQEKSQPTELPLVNITVPTNHEYATGGLFMAEELGVAKDQQPRVYWLQRLLDPMGKELDEKGLARYSNNHSTLSVRVHLDSIDPNPKIEEKHRRLYYGQLFENSLA